MTTDGTKPVIFISYAHADEPENPREGEVKWLSFVAGHLRPVVKHGAVDIWVDTLMRGGDDWDPEIERKLRGCDVFVLLVSRYSTSSDYVVDKEIAIIRDRQKNREDVRFYPLLLTPTADAGLRRRARQEFASARRQAVLKLFATRPRSAHGGRRQRDRGDRGGDRRPQSRARAAI